MECQNQERNLDSGCCDKTSASTEASDICEVTEQPLQSLKLASHAVLEEAQQRGRLKCSKCGGSRKFFCYTCCSLVGVTREEIPLIKLPVKIDIIKHPNETDGKSTAIHAKILAPNDVTIYTYPCIPDFEKDKVVMVFPGPQAVSVQDMIQCLHDQSNSRLHHTSYEPMKKRLKCDDLGGSTCTEESFQTGSSDTTKGSEPRQRLLQRVVFIDSTWNQTNKISTDERLQDLLQVELKMRKTCFWRHQKGKPDSYLATIEAIYYFLRDYHKYCLGQEYDGEYDNLLFFYSFLHSVVNKAKTERKT
ncbi:tRNA-uridine aminocarboxypropyltransferase 1 [Takifugu rubripes]|uniref:tRNA-uridine aminocarboxypropyltransferase 1 n=1 Tax=Takifugu rubripes TaxID=31033 RepID=UPI000298A391|nr:DTW domain-containing protein 1 [Takifugu rubripes]XP_011608298.1 DTW domain-containing protein 1 [Takifugu rubripes]XP_011608299.1 DTW domain-containing protein 1 [Takifugu rubripes]XP_011608300.1 DTW domain-containing protein 1 [Takifugu rubripes]XP_056869939.1 tRNA-uridine aminocarboxypropyltransferase 1 [Takifugu flavidus]XP_056869948.1 tRNA-uridine aminocarboxypropyltransferase 1 [Takifugu flavidus]XP_056869958.1 tRNA-uridine aminocarboxypropyltransferase 1 [Takifugu flavidus]|eukprot:XP_003969880.1 PREDICTED: DTW domain-containing protein 1 [Takifugu rubripes]